ncbi:MAG: 2Fe-2S iron-sulfur cluster-binding protein [Bdellovibrionales bacterium]
MKVKFMPQDVEFEIKPGQSVMDLAHEKGIEIRSTCNGMPSCAECRVKVTDGEWNLNPPSRKELNLIGTGFYIDQRRLSCQMLCFGDVTVDTAEQIEKAAEGPVTKKFLSKVHKQSPQESHSLGGVLIEQDGALLQELKADVEAVESRGGDRSANDSGGGGGNRQHQSRDRGHGGRDRGHGHGDRDRQGGGNRDRHGGGRDRNPNRDRHRDGGQGPSRQVSPGGPQGHAEGRAPQPQGQGGGQQGGGGRRRRRRR